MGQTKLNCLVWPFLFIGLNILFFKRMEMWYNKVDRLIIFLNQSIMFNLTSAQLFPLLSMVFILGLGFFVLLKNQRSILNRLFFLISVVFAIWQFGTFMMFINLEDQQIIFWDRFIYLGVVFMPALQYHFSLVFTHFSKKRKRMLIVAYIFSFVFLILSRTNYFVANVFKYRWGVHTEAQIFHHFFLAFFFFYIFALLYNFYIQYKQTNIQIEKHKLVYTTVSFTILNLVGGLGYLPAYKISIYSPISLVAPLVFSILITYAIVRHQLMDIKIALRRYSVFLISVISIVIPAVAVKYILLLHFNIDSAWIDIIIFVLAVLFFPGIKKYFYYQANKYFFSSLYDSHEVIIALSDKLRSTLEVKEIYRFTRDIFSNAFHTNAFALLNYNKKTENYVMWYGRGFNMGAKEARNGVLKIDKEWRKIYLTQNAPIVLEELKAANRKKDKKTVNLLNMASIEVLMPLNVKDEHIGLIALGPKESKDMYNIEDLKVLRVAGAQVAIALENAILYEETLDFNIKLRKEIKRATGDLKKANAVLKKIDEAKSDFISIASHQLRTPLTVIKGYISMILEGSFEKVGPKAHDALVKVFASSERLIQLVGDLLNISRIESGRLQFDYKVTALENTVESVVEELASTAKKKGLSLKYKKPDKFLPKVRIDQEKIRQVVMNLIDNAIKYTKKGNITVTLEKINSNIRFCVTDTGMGISQDNISHLFQKFSRGSGSLVHTEGTGLGLYVARQMAEAHKGRIWAESKGEGNGSMFCFELPIHK